MKTNNNFSTQIHLLLDHIISTFDVKFGLLWMAGTDSFFTNLESKEDTYFNTETLISFLAGYYYRFVCDDNKHFPIIIQNVFQASGVPVNLLKLAKIKNLTSFLISPVMKNNDVKGALILGSNDDNVVKKINPDLLMLLTDVALNLNGNNHEDEGNHEKQIWKHSFGLLIGKSKQMQDIYKTILKISKSDANVFIFGESGTGKELIARTIHENSHRQHQTFIPVDCVALPGSLLESELFGFEKGAFTGANNIKRGLIEYADKGTFFLDEITEMQYDLQAKLLRVLQERQFRRLGGKKLIDIDIRIISTTNREPHDAIAKKILREDLFFRLNVIPIFIPPLCERKEDIPLLIDHFIKDISQSNDVSPIEISEDAMEKLIDYKWAGNVRELRNIMERVIALAKSDTIHVEDLPDEIKIVDSRNSPVDNPAPVTLPYNQAKQQNLVTFERSYFSRLIEKFNGNISRVAKEARVSRKTIYNILKKHSLNSYQNFSVVNYEGRKNENNNVINLNFK